MSMSVAEARSEISGLYQKAAEIENRYPDGLTQEANHEDFDEVKRLLTEIDGLENSLAGLEDAAARKARILDNQKHFQKPVRGHEQPQGDGPMSPALKMFGAQFIESEEYKRAAESGIFRSRDMVPQFAVNIEGSLMAWMQRKALVYSGSGVGGPLITNDRLGGVYEILQRETSLLDLIPNASDMAGLYVSPESQMRVTVYLCGIEALWANDDGTHRAEYTIVEHLHTGVLIGRSFAGPGLDNRMTLGVKPAEPGYIEAFTMSPFMTDLRIYRLRKIS